MPSMSEHVTLSKLTVELKDAPHCLALYQGLTSQEEANSDARELNWQKIQRQNDRVTEAQRIVNIARADTLSAEYRNESERAAQDLANAEAKLKIEIDKRKAMQSTPVYDGLPSAKLANVIQKIMFGHRLRKGAPNVEPSMEGIEKAQADRAKLEAELEGVLKAPCDEAEAIKRANADLDRAIANVKHRWPFTRYYRSEKDAAGRYRPAHVGLPKTDAPGGGTVPDAYSLVLLTLAPVIRESIVRQVKDAASRFEFDNPLTAAARNKAVEGLQKKIAGCIAVEAAHIRGLALAGQCPAIRNDFPIAELLSLEPIPEAKAEFEAEQAAIARRGGTHVMPGNDGGKLVNAAV